MVAVDLSGHGDSGRRAPQCGPLVFAVDIHEVALALGAGPTYLVGHSMGGRCGESVHSPPANSSPPRSALSQRKKGRDLFDLWLALTELDLTGEDLLEVFGPYRPEKFTAALAEQNLRAKISDQEFRTDLDSYVTGLPNAYGLEAAADLVIAQVLSKL